MADMTWSWVPALAILGAIVYVAHRVAGRAPERHRRFGSGHIRQAVDHRFGRFGGTYQEDVIRREGVLQVGRNEQCPCGSGTKFKRCCRSSG